MQPSNITSGGGNGKGNVESIVAIESSVNPKNFLDVVEELKEKYNSQLPSLSDYDKHELFYKELKQFFTSTINTLPSIEEIIQVITQVNSIESFFQIPQFKHVLIYCVIDCLQTLQREFCEESDQRLNLNPLNLANKFIHEGSIIHKGLAVGNAILIPNGLTLVGNAILLNIKVAKKSGEWYLLITAKNYLTKYNDNLEAKSLNSLFNKLSEAFDEVPERYDINVNTEKYNLFLDLFSKLDDETKIKFINSFFQLKNIWYSLDEVTAYQLIILYDRIVQSSLVENLSLQDRVIIDRVMLTVLKFIAESEAIFEQNLLQKFVKNICVPENDENQMYLLNMLINKLTKMQNTQNAKYYIGIIEQIFIYSQSPQVVKKITNSPYMACINIKMIKKKYSNSSEKVLNLLVEYYAKQNMIMQYNTNWVPDWELIEVKVFNLIESLIQNDETKIDQPFEVIYSKIDALIKGRAIRDKIKKQFYRFIVLDGFSGIYPNHDRKRKHNPENNKPLIYYIKHSVFKGLKVDSVLLFSTIIKFLNNDNLQWGDKFQDVNSRWIAWLLGFNRYLIKDGSDVIGDFIKTAICSVNKFHPLIEQAADIFDYAQTNKKNITIFILGQTDNIYEVLSILEENEEGNEISFPDVNSEGFLNQLKNLYLQPERYEDLHEDIINSVEKMIESQTNLEFKFSLVSFCYDMIYCLDQAYEESINNLEKLKTVNEQNLFEKIKQIIVEKNNNLAQSEINEQETPLDQEESNLEM